MPANRSSRVFIVGGGIGGLAAALALGRVGIQAEVFERAPALEEVGAGLSLWSNAVAALRRLGLDEAVLSRGTVIGRSVTMDHRGRTLGEESIADLGRRAGHPSACVHRADLQGILAGSLESGRLRLGAAVDGVEQDAEGVTIRRADGQTERGALLVGADGLHSVVRAQLHRPAPPRYAGYVAYRGLARFEHPEVPPGTMRLLVGPGSQVGLLPCGPGRLYWFATVNAPGVGRPPGGAAEVRARFRDWYAPVPAMIEATDDAAILRNDILDRPPIWPWGLGRATLLGDAAHPTTPNLGQGACQALEDAVALADRLRRDGLTPDALRTYEASRRRRTELVIRQSWSMGRVLQWEGRPATWLRDALIRSPFGRRRARALFEELLNHESPDLGPIVAPAVSL